MRGTEIQDRRGSFGGAGESVTRDKSPYESRLNFSPAVGNRRKGNSIHLRIGNVRECKTDFVRNVGDTVTRPPHHKRKRTPLKPD